MWTVSPVREDGVRDDPVVVVGERGAITAVEWPGVGSSSWWLDGAHTALICNSRSVENNRVRAWLGAALRQGRQVFYMYATAEPVVRRWLTTLVGGDVLDSERVVLVDAERCHAETGDSRRRCGPGIGR
jgi:hypothetical protein